MADISDVQNALVALVAQAIYPNGTGAPSITRANTIIYGGWPQASQLDADLSAFSSGAAAQAAKVNSDLSSYTGPTGGVPISQLNSDLSAYLNGGPGRLHVTIYPGGAESNVTRYMTGLQTLSTVPATLVFTVSGQTITLSGSISTPQNVALLINGQPYTYAVQASDTLTSIATALANQVQGASNTGAVITIPAGMRIDAARAGGSGTAFQELRRQKKIVQITVWADTPDHRDATAAAIDVALASTNFLTLADGSSGRLIYQSSMQDDSKQRANLYRRDLMYSAEYSTTQSFAATEVVMTQENLHTGVTGVAADLNSSTVYQ